MSLVFSVPGKTFLAGEYLALHGGPTLVFLSQPYFKFTVTKGSGSFPELHPQSPAGRFITKYKSYFDQFDAQFEDPYQGKGGFGASTAQFLSCYALWLYKDAAQQDMEKLLDIKHLLEEYYFAAWTGEGIRPSGADLVGQLKGSLTFFEKRKGLISVKSWPFRDLDFFVIHTGNKIATHEHLKNLPEFNSDGLEKSFAVIKESFDTEDGKLFVQGINAYAQELANLNFTCDETLILLQEIRKLNGVKAAKGCGALGADVILAVTLKNETDEFKKYCERRGLPILASSNDLGAGLLAQGTL